MLIDLVKAFHEVANHLHTIQSRIRPAYPCGGRFGSHLLGRGSPAGPVFLTRARADAYYPASMAHKFLAA
jgi:hypothetical protein